MGKRSLDGPILGMMALGIVTAGCSSARADVGADGGTLPVPSDPSVTQLRQDLVQLRADVTKQRDEKAIEALGYCYARGLDEIALHYADRPRGITLATALYTGCFDANVEISVYPVAAKTPFKKTRGIKEWVEFADAFYAGGGFASTRHLTSNFAVERTGDTTARMVSYAVGPHFVRSAAKDAASAAPTIDYYSLRYVDEVARQSNGSWRVVSKSVYFDEVWRGVGFFPGGNSDGS